MEMQIKSKSRIYTIVAIGLILFFCGYIIGMYGNAVLIFVANEWKGVFSVIATTLSPIIAILVSELWLRKKIEKELIKRNVLHDLVRYRGQATGKSQQKPLEFSQTLNLVLLYWGNNDEIKKIIYQLRQGPAKAELIVEVIYKICVMEGINYLSREDIENAFVEGL